MGDIQLVQTGGQWHGRFSAMASPCEIMAHDAGEQTVRQLTETAFAEAKRIEQKFSRYRDDSVVSRINGSHGSPVPIDEETHRLLQYADQLFRLSGGRFDITSGVLRRVWKFDGSDRIPAPEQVQALLPLIGWERVSAGRDHVTMPAGMQLDLGGIGKEYAVDRALAQLSAAHPGPILVNFGGDIATNGQRYLGTAQEREWAVGIEAAEGGRFATVHLKSGAIATSGDARRFLLKAGRRYGHILDPRTGWPVPDAPRSVTVVAASCVEAGTLSTLAMLQGAGAEAFLAAQDHPHWVQR